MRSAGGRSSADNRMHRRRVLTALAALAVAPWLSGHTPYRQWKVYRQRHLLILSSRDDPPSDELAERFAATLRETLPASHAQVARAPHVQRIASLISTHQMDVAVLQERHSSALFLGEPPFAEFGRVPLRVLIQSGGYQFVSRQDFPDRHAYLVTEALSRNLPGVQADLSPPANGVPLHAGAIAFLRGDPLED
jgi:hypothetical protein